MPGAAKPSTSSVASVVDDTASALNKPAHQAANAGSASWLSGASSPWPWNAQLQETLNRRVQDLGESIRTANLNFVEQRDAVISSAHAAIRDASEKVASDAAQMAAAAAETAEKVAAGAKGMRGGFWSASGEEDATIQELASKFIVEAHTIQKQVESGTPIDSSILDAWEEKLATVYEIEGTRKVVHAFLQSGALLTVVEALMDSPSHRDLLRHTQEEDHTVGRTLVRLSSQASGTGTCLLAQSLALIADAADAVDEVEENSDASVMNAAKEDSRWALLLFRAALVDSQEKQLLEIGPLLEALTEALSTEHTATTPKGSKVWAIFRGNGSWYQAQVESAREGVLEVTWLRPPADLDGVDENEFVFETGLDDTQYKSVGVEDVVPLSQPRPSSTEHANDQDRPGQWTQRLEAVEATTRKFKELRQLKEQLDAWVRAPNTGVGVSPPPARTSTSDLLYKMGEDLRQLRADGDSRAEVINSKMTSCGQLELALQERWQASSGSLRNELAAVCSEQEHVSQELTRQYQERQRLLDELNAADQKIIDLQRRTQELHEREQEVRHEVDNSSCNIRKELQAVEERSRVFILQKKLVTSASDIAEVVEQDVETRMVSAVNLMRQRENARSSGPALASACLAQELSRTRAFERLTSSLYAAVWSSAESFRNDAAQVSSLHSIHEKALVLVERAWRDAVQLAADNLGSKSAPSGLSEALSDCAERYKDMRQQLQTNQRYMAKWGDHRPAVTKADKPLVNPPTLCVAEDSVNGAC